MKTVTFAQVEALAEYIGKQIAKERAANRDEIGALRAELTALRAEVTELRAPMPPQRQRRQGCMRAPDTFSRQRRQLLRETLSEYSAAVERFVSSCQTLLAWEMQAREQAAREAAPQAEPQRRTARRRIAPRAPSQAIAPPPKRRLELVSPTA